MLHLNDAPVKDVFIIVVVLLPLWSLVTLFMLVLPILMKTYR